MKKQIIFSSFNFYILKLSKCMKDMHKNVNRMNVDRTKKNKQIITV